jgi:hypothetical protein
MRRFGGETTMTRRPYLAAASCLSIALAGEATAEALKFDIPNANGATFTLYGQFDPAFQYVDDGFDSYTAFVDNASSNSRIGFNLEGQRGQTSLLFNFETAFGVRPSDGTSQTDLPPAIAWDRTDIRHLEVIASGPGGTVFFGQGRMATDGVTEFDLSGATLVTKTAVQDSAGGFFFREGDGTLSDIAISEVFTNLDGSRRFRLRYDTPAFQGFTLRAAAGIDVLREDDDGDYYDAAVVYSNTLGGVAVEGGVGYALRTAPGVEDQDRVSGSVTALLPGGLNFTFAAGRLLSGTEGSYVYGKVGYIARILDVGTTRFAVDYNIANDFDSVGSKGTTLGVGIVQQFADPNVEAYVGYQSYAFENASGTSYADMSSLLVGARWRF